MITERKKKNHYFNTRTKLKKTKQGNALLR